MPLPENHRRVIVEGIRPQVDGGRFPIKRILGDEVVVEADIFADGHEVLNCLLQQRHESENNWHEQALAELGNDRWRAAFQVTKLGVYFYRIIGWINRFHTWRHELQKRAAAGQNLQVELLIGAQLVEAAAKRATAAESSRLNEFARALAGNQHDGSDQAARYHAAMDTTLLALMDRNAERSEATTSEELSITVDNQRAAFSAWYELFPRSLGVSPQHHGTFQDVIRTLPYLGSLGFDVLYMPPIHPIGEAFRKGKNNQERGEADDVGSPWAIGSAEGGHKAIHPALGTLDDFRALVQAAAEREIEIALDIAFQCSPDHPYVKEHPEWFRRRPDGTIQYAENPPKKYQDIYPFDFDCQQWQSLWNELKSVFLYWIEQGVRIFRVDNPHTKPFPFWEWCLQEVKRVRPDAIFLAEAFTRPKIMYRLAKLGFTQSYTYFTWRNTKQELTEYFTELTRPELADIFRPNLWVNTPDILHDYLQHGGRAAFIVRAVLAATLGANWGVYGPAYELLEHAPREPGSEEYLHSEKYELRHWELNRSDSLSGLLARLNRIRRQQPALMLNEFLAFHNIGSDQLLAYTKRTADASNVVLVIVNLDPHHAHSGWVELPLEEFRLGGNREVVDLIGDQSFQWQGTRAYIELDPREQPAHIFQIRGFSPNMV